MSSAAADPLACALEDHRAGRLEAATAGYRAVLASAPEHPDALHLLGVARKAAGALDEAVGLIRRAAALQPGRAEIWSNLGNALAAAGDHPGAIDAYRTALGLQETADTWTALGASLAKAGEADGAIAAYERALALDPADVTARHNLANALGARGRDGAAVTLLRAVIADQPDLAEAHYNLARHLLRLGDYKSGFSHYEWRWKTEAFPDKRRHTHLPDWDGRPLPGRLLVHAEQGFGDTIQFAALLPLARSLATAVTLEVPAPLARLFRRFTGADTIAAAVPDSGQDLPANVAAATALLGLPHRLGLTLGSIPSAAGLLTAEPDRVAAWRARLGDDGRRIVTVNHQGSPKTPVDRGRSLPDPALLAPLAALPDIRLISLQKLAPPAIEPDGGGYRLAGLPVRIEHPGPDLDAGPDAFVDTAAIMTLADAVVSTDTAAAHLAGALGRPVHILLQAVAEWRWLIDRTTTPWYPTATLHRQPAPGDWGTVIDAVAGRLRDGDLS
ncbi:tetratricopeptide repeat protein [Mongoliimonas terrestris]|uniref:tetratricopeptide repeat protein n=1 Tax=Mongoliimonas terrestris TaxID=1709001 RepID=UPI00094950ED|nr:tetratricopeptide repeat protein [Mongoliimonas terrestris]